MEIPPKAVNGGAGIYAKQSFGGPDGFLLYQIGAKADGNWHIRPDTWLTGELDARVLDNYSKFKVDGPSNLPRVRTDVRQYVESSRVTMPLLQLTHVGRLSNDQYYSVYGGMLESMYGGVGAEWLYRPWGSPVALGVDANVVRQRGYNQDFSFRSYQVGTGHLTLYWDTGISDIQTNLSVGKYLAGDIGATIDISRVFSNGVQMGAWMTKTNVSAEQFGEGSFDKGIYVKIPFDAMLLTSSGSIANLVWHPLLRDGGARLERAITLESLTRGHKGDSLRWQPFSNTRTSQFGDVGDDYSDGQMRVSAFNAFGQDMALIGDGMSHADFWKTALIAGGITAASALLDKPADTLAQKYGGKKIIKGLEQTSSYLPLLTFGYSGLMALGEHNPTLAKASYASLEAGGVGVLAALGIKMALGRSRPLLDLGPGHFTPMSSGNSNASFPSIHATLAWATLTPYAIAYDQPWLYGLAALTNVARIGERKHWLSDTVAGGFLGYGLGSLFWASRQDHKSVPSLYLAPNEVGLQWHTQ
jgi:membrane-associated phospholipid phosphatase